MLALLPNKYASYRKEALSLFICELEHFTIDGFAFLFLCFLVDDNTYKAILYNSNSNDDGAISLMFKGMLGLWWFSLKEASLLSSSLEFF